MRFAYMDSHGNEVAIPSVDALALRIELGAISADTELYDAQADRWGPAHTHDIFHTLTRDAGEEGLVAPPPAMASPPPASESPSVEGAESEADPGLDDLDFSLADAPEVEPAGGASADAGDTDFGEVGFDPAPEAVDKPSGDGSDEEYGSFDLGDFSGLIEEELSVGDVSEPETVSADPGGGMDSPMDLSGAGMQLEPPMDFGGGGDTGIADGGLELDKPLSDYTPEAPPAEQQEDQDDSPMDFGGVTSSPAVSDPSETARVAGGDEVPRERKPRSRPSAPRRPKKAPVGMIVGVVVILGGGAAGFFAWQLFTGTEVVETPALPPVVIPDIPAELLPRMRDMAEAAVIAMVEDLRGRSAALDIPTQPRDAWLGGNYLSNASQFEDIEQFWVGIERFVDDVRSTDAQLFHDKYVQQTEAAGIAADTAAMLIERADSGFVAARDSRFEAYNLMDDLLNAALDLHLFLLDNEQLIEYEPASAGISRDPVLEAVPSTEMLGDEMWGLVGGITDALAALGTLDRVTRERLFAVLFDRIRSAGVQ